MLIATRAPAADLQADTTNKQSNNLGNVNLYFVFLPEVFRELHVVQPNLHGPVLNHCRQTETLIAFLSFRIAERLSAQWAIFSPAVGHC